MISIPLRVAHGLALIIADWDALRAVEVCALRAVAAETSLIELSITAGEATLTVPESIGRAHALRVLSIPGLAICAWVVGHAASTVVKSVNRAETADRCALTVDPVHVWGALALEGLAGIAIEIRS